MISRNKVDYARELNQEQLAVVTSKPGPALVLAGAGSGKTRTLIYRLSWLVDQGFAKDRLLLLTFTNKAAKEMISRSESLLSGHGQGGNLWGGTFHHTALRLLRRYHAAANLKPQFTIADTDDSQTLIKAIMKQFGLAAGGQKRLSPAVIRDVISFSRNAGISIAETVERKYPEQIKQTAMIEQVAAEYEQRKQRSSVLDFDDLLHYWLRLLSDERQRAVIARNWDYILVDEYQDTNWIQDRIVRLLAQDHHNVLAVGDDAQSIYSFRAAQIDNILQFPQAFPETQIFRLERNYRSAPEILNLANEVIAGNTKQFRKNLYTEESAASKPELMIFGDPSQEASWIVNRVLNLEDEGVNLSNIAVLFRAAHLSQDLELELNKRGVPYEMRGGLKFFERAHIKDVLSYLRLWENPQDESSWRRVLLLQNGIGEVAVNKIIAHVQKHETLTDIIDSEPGLSAQARAGWQDFISMMRRMQKLDKPKAGGLVRALATDYGRYLSASYADYRERQEDVEQLALYADRFETLSDFLAQTSLQENFALRSELEPKRDSALVLSTVHQAKGLEWHAVFVLNVSDKSFPHPRAIAEPGGVEEERRLFYVAITRAKRYLYFTYPVSGSAYALNINQPSPFLREVNQSLLGGDMLQTGNDIISIGSDGERSFLPSIDSL